MHTAGLSRSLVGQDGLVQVGNAVGTISYTAPETFTENVLQKPSDVFAFGILSESSMLKNPATAGSWLCIHHPSCCDDFSTAVQIHAMHWRPVTLGLSLPKVPREHFWAFASGGSVCRAACSWGMPRIIKLQQVPQILTDFEGLWAQCGRSSTASQHMRGCWRSKSVTWSQSRGCALILTTHARCHTRTLRRHAGTKVQPAGAPPPL